MADTTFYKRGNAYHDSAGNPAIIEKGNELTFTEHFNAGGGGTPYTPPAYSTDEVDTGTIWIDGKPVYRKVINVENILVGNDVETNLGNANNIAQIINCAVLTPNSDRAFTSCTSWINNGSLFVRTLSTRVTTDISVIIEYTKTAQTLTNTRTSKKKG